ncbi:hypothetical protein H6P81_013309 [Aristolochia fimbriata]|uniref:Uncharacterized protein n=1 Tax=Aristolochia fimbriata TaxID=158543 RepID=A0AAV7EHI3_ARIFI|nr:hypothetical protein H6P81_013309 [Aristolochia fimbriata]
MRMKLRIFLSRKKPRLSLSQNGLVEAAIKSYTEALFLRPDLPEATCNLLHTLQGHLVFFSTLTPCSLGAYKWCQSVNGHDCSISPLSMGILSGKYFSPDGAPPDGRMNGFRGKYSEGESKYNLSNATVRAATKDQHRDELPSRDKAEKEKLLIELEAALMDKSNQCTETLSKLKTAVEEATNLRRELDISQKLLDECQMNCAHLENCLHEAREEACTNLCAADRRASEYSALCTSAVKTCGLFERLHSCVTAPGGVAGFANSLRALALSLASSANENEDDATADIRACISLLAEKRRKNWLKASMPSISLKNREYESGPSCNGLFWWKTSTTQTGTVKQGSRVRSHKSAHFSLFGQCQKSKATESRCVK